MSLCGNDADASKMAVRYKAAFPTRNTYRCLCIASIMLFTTGYSHAAEPDREKLPIPQPHFEGNIGKTFEESKQHYPQPLIDRLTLLETLRITVSAPRRIRS